MASSPPRNGLDEIAQALVLADGDGEADTLIAAGDDDVVGVEAAVGTHGELTRGSGTAHAAHRLRRKLAAPRAVLARPWRSRAMSISPVSAVVANIG